MSEHKEQVRVFLVDGMVQEVALTGPWEQFVADYIRNGCILIGSGIIERGGIRYLQRELLLPEGAKGPGTVVSLVPKDPDPS